MTRNIIIGGGIAGLCTAYHLTQSGQKVTLIEAGEIGQKCSNKAAGMITPASEVHLGEDDLMTCFLRSSEYYDKFINDLTNDQPELVDFHRTGSLMCATDQDGGRELTRLAEFQRQMGLEVEELSNQELASLEPMLSHKTILALYSKAEAYVDNVKLLQQLKKSLLKSGLCDILENKKVTHIKFENDTIDKIIINENEPTELKADNYILTTGLKHDLKELNRVFSLPLRPVKGQTLTIQCAPKTINRPIRIYHRYPIYLVPRNDGQIVIGATSEELSDEFMTAGGLMDLIYAAWQALPIIYDSPVVETKVGLRPATPDHKPVVGQTPLKNLYVLTGLYRHGIMAAPYLSKQLVHMMNGEETEMNLEKFSINRFN